MHPNYKFLSFRGRISAEILKVCGEELLSQIYNFIVHIWEKGGCTRVVQRCGNQDHLQNKGQVQLWYQWVGLPAVCNREHHWQEPLQLPSSCGQRVVHWSTVWILSVIIFILHIKKKGTATATVICFYSIKRICGILSSNSAGYKFLDIL